MQKLSFIIVCLWAAMLCNFRTDAQTSVLTESFDGTTFAPTGWTNNIIVGTQAFIRVTSGANPTISNHSGAGMAEYNMFSLSSGYRAELSTPPLTLPSGSFASFWMYRDAGYAGYNEGVRVYSNTSPSSTGATLLGTVNRANNMPPTVTTDGWYQYTFPIPVSGSGIYIVFEGFSAYGNNLFLDDVNIYYMCSQPTALAASLVAKNSATLSWGAVAASAGYEYVLDYTAANPTGAGTVTTATTLNFTGLNSGTTYYMHVRNKCISGSLSAWVTTSFTTLPGTTCPGITNLYATPVTSTVVNLAFNGVPGSAGYVYVIDEKPGDPVVGYVATTQSNFNVLGLNPMTTYYAHVRNVCSDNLSPWTTTSFVTPQCSKPNNLFFTGITTNSVDLVWSLMPNVQQYEYKVDVAPTGYNNPNNFIITTGMTAHVTSLQPDTKYYVFLRSRCFSGLDSSQWKIDSFVTSFECGKPDLKVTGLGTISPTGTWDEVYKAVAYEYALTNSITPPAFGTVIKTNTVTVTLPTDGTEQYLHVRTQCNSQFTTSDWATAQLRSTGIQEPLVGGIIASVYPNPVKDLLTVELSTWQNKGASLSLTDITGKVLINTPLASGKVVLNTHGLAPGIYLLRYADDTHNEVTRVNKQ